MAGLGRITVDERGLILAVDTPFCITMRGAPEILVGANILDFTAPADRERCIVVLSTIRGAPEPLVTVKRMIRCDGTHFWVHNTVAVAPSPDKMGPIVISIEESAPPSDWIDPARLLDIAHLFFDARRTRKTVFREALFSDHAWDILLAAYIAEAEGGVLTVADLQISIGISAMNASRWIRALSADGLLEYEEGGNALITAPLRLSCEAHRRFERYLSDLYRDREKPASNLEFYR